MHRMGDQGRTTLINRTPTTAAHVQTLGSQRICTNAVCSDATLKVSLAHFKPQGCDGGAGIRWKQASTLQIFTPISNANFPHCR